MEIGIHAVRNTAIQDGRVKGGSAASVASDSFAGEAPAASVVVPAELPEVPAAQELNLNPSLLTGFLEEKFGLPAVSANILRKKFLTADKQLFV